MLEEIWNDGSLKLWLASFAEMFFDEKVSEEVSEFVREKMRERLKDPRLCELLIPTGLWVRHASRPARVRLP